MGLIGIFEGTVISEGDEGQQDTEMPRQDLTVDEEDFSDDPQVESPKRSRVEVVIPPWLGSPPPGRAIEYVDE